jgi:hypothetical protein
MAKKVIVEFVKYDSVAVELPERFSENISDWSEDQKQEIAELAQDKMYKRNYDPDWAINEDNEDQGFIEIVDE